MALNYDKEDESAYIIGFNGEFMRALWEHLFGPRFCLNACRLSSWVRRLWFRQELSYSPFVRYVWAGKEIAKCVFVPDRACKGDIDTNGLQPYAALLLHQFTHVSTTTMRAGTKPLP